MSISGTIMAPALPDFSIELKAVCSLGNGVYSSHFKHRKSENEEKKQSAGIMGEN